MEALWVNGAAQAANGSLYGTEAFQFGAGVFETLRVKAGKPLYLERHLARMAASVSVLGLGKTPGPERMADWVLRAVAAGKTADAALKLIWHPGGDAGTVIVTLRPIPYGPEHLQAGLRLGLAAIRREPTSRIVRHKTLNYLENLLERRAAKDAGWDEALVLDTEGHAAEGTASNLFIRRDGVLMTPPVEAPLLPGIRRALVLEAAGAAGIPTLETPLTLEMVRTADHLYLTNSLMGILPVCNFAGTCYDKDIELCVRLNGLLDS